MPSTEPAPAAALKAAIERADDEACFHLLTELAGASGHLPGLLPATFEELAAKGLPRAAVKLAQLECGSADLREACDATPQGGSYLHAAAAAGAGAPVVAALLAAGCAVDGRCAEGGTALHAAARAGHLATCTALVEAGCDPLARNSNGRTARAQGGVGEAARALLQEAEEAGRERWRAQQGALWDGKMSACQTANACRLGCL
ncbi:hypothetical protein CHLNCDRAFT_55321 [Chlorella variabilis]|uniref:Uncharacterized protein n=1 Tax=Chlorella variabilis TaxID=554065 RepID=E1ZSQ7_CHLVA|nr:hypothetical protein CHLNCDRAFT_55321 [Chlorella variabilis]EFN51148.1 hypothetical protein CHLNCDRAFT_55321 [Chlorella variabilis]|eukprot:XP_005843250.1 hypothetical protein CHLNCDRAFT_55321 [Chlorella variabilis]